MGVTYKLKDEVVHFIVSQRQGNPLASCRQLAESVSQKFGLQLSKSSVHDVLKESGIITPRGRKPKDKFEIPQEKKKQIQVSLSQVKLLPDPVESEPEEIPSMPPTPIETEPRNNTEISSEYEGAGKIFLKAARWDLGIYSEENIKAADWNYYLTYTKGIKVTLENNKDFFVDLPVPLERCIRETADGLINNIRPFIVHQVSDQELFKACMEAQTGFKINNISIVDGSDRILLELGNIMEYKRKYVSINRTFVECNDVNSIERAKSVFFTQSIDNNMFMNNILNLEGFDTTNNDENVVTFLIKNSYDNRNGLEAAAEKLNGMYLYDEQGRLVKVKIQGLPD